MNWTTFTFWLPPSDCSATLKPPSRILRPTVTDQRMTPYTRLLQRCQSDAAALWAEVQPCVAQCSGTLVLDDTTLDKPYARVMGLVTRYWSGKRRAVVQGINLVTLLWTDGAGHRPCDFRIYDTSDGLTKNDHFRAMPHFRTNASESRASGQRASARRGLLVRLSYASYEFVEKRGPHAGATRRTAPTTPRRTNQKQQTRHTSERKAAPPRPNSRLTQV
jgi:hypothetical protein